MSKEPHQEGGFHYHVSILCAKSIRLKKRTSDAPVEFYDCAYLYITKRDKNNKHGHVLSKHPSHESCLEADRNPRRIFAKEANSASAAAAKVRREKDEEGQGAKKKKA